MTQLSPFLPLPKPRGRFERRIILRMKSPSHDRNLVLRQVALFSATLDVSSPHSYRLRCGSALLSLDSIMQKYDNSRGRWSLLDKCHACPLINPRALVSSPFVAMYPDVIYISFALSAERDVTINLLSFFTVLILGSSNG